MKSILVAATLCFCTIIFGGQAHSSAVCDPTTQGALGNGVTDDTAAFNSCLVLIEASPSKTGAIEVPPPPAGPSYCIKSGPIVLPGFVTLYGDGAGVTLSACGGGTSILELNGHKNYARDLILLGPGVDGESGFSATADTVILDPNCSYSKLSNLTIFGGRHAIRWNCNEATIEHIDAAFSYGSAIIFFQGSASTSAGGWIFDLRPDSTDYPQGSVPPQGSTYAPWQANHSGYAAGEVVSMICQDGKAYYFQAMSGGGSGLTQPACANYGMNMPDNVAVWQLAFPAPSYHIQFDTYTNEVKIDRCDSGGGSAGIALTDALGGGGPQQIQMVNCQGGGGYQANILAVAGGTLDLVNFHTAGCIEAGCSNMIFQADFAGSVSITGGYNVGSPYGISINRGNGYTIQGVENFSGNGVPISIGNNADHITVVGNVQCPAPCVSNGSSGTHIEVGYNQ